MNSDSNPPNDPNDDIVLKLLNEQARIQRQERLLQVEQSAEEEQKQAAVVGNSNESGVESSMAKGSSCSNESELDIEHSKPSTSTRRVENDEKLLEEGLTQLALASQEGVPGAYAEAPSRPLESTREDGANDTSAVGEVGLLEARPVA